MKKATIILLMAVLVLVLSVGAFPFQNEPDGFRGLKWGDTPTEDMEYYLKRQFDIKVYIRLDDKMKIGGARLRSIHYLFYEGRFMAVEIKPDILFDGYDALKDVVLLKFGDGKVIGKDFSGEKIVWLGDLATIVLEKSLRDGIELLLIYSTEIWEEKEEEFSVKKEEAERKEEEERRKAAEKGLDDF